MWPLCEEAFGDIQEASLNQGEEPVIMDMDCRGEEVRSL